MAKVPYVDPDLCTGCELCVDTCPDVFKMNDEGLAEVSDPTGDSEERKAAPNFQNPRHYRT